MAKKKLKAQDPRSEAAIHRLIRRWDLTQMRVQFSDSGKERELYILRGDKLAAVIDLRALVRKRKPLTGVKKEFAKIVRGSK